ncbi:MAG: TldD/PmbA family protein [Oscillospiraceae bacterium]|jgi:PmbA protein|nr:TldD/PmbA family protein [Oscillospiraceae bacterium]
MKNELYKAAEFALAELKTQGADGAEVTVSKQRTEELNVDAGKFSLMRTTFNSTLTIRALVGGRKGVFSLNALDDASVVKAAKSAVESALNSEPDDAEIIADSIGEHDFSSGIAEPNLDKLYDRIDEYMKSVAAEFPKVDLMQIVTNVEMPAMLYANSNGTRVFQQLGWYEFSGTFSGRDGEKTSSMSGYGFAVDDLETPFLDIAEMRRIHREAEAQIETVPVSGKFVGKLLVAPDCVTTFLGSVLSNCVSTGSLIAGVSPWRDKLGEPVANPRLSLASDPLNPAFVGTSRLTSDGYLVGRQEIIADGVLTGFLLSQYGARKTGKSRASSYGGSYVMAPGDKTFDELLASIDEGVLVNRFSGGSPALNGEFSGVAKNSFMIRNGKICEAVSETMISGNLLEMLTHVAGIGSELINDGSKLVPWVLFDGVTVSGK